MSDNSVQLIITIAVIALVGVFVWSVMSGAAVDFGVSTGDESFEYLSSGDTFDLGTNAQNVEVAATSEHAMAFAAEGHVAATSGHGWYGDDWSVFVSAWLDDAANAAATYTVLAYDNETVVVAFADGAWHAYHFVGEDSAHASINADDPANRTSLGVVWDNSTGELTISDGSNSDTAPLTAETPTRSVGSDWFGVIDEVRFLGDDRADLVPVYTDDPVHPLDGEAHTARYLFDEGSGDATRAWYADIDVAIVDGQWTGGVAGPDLVADDDYIVDGSTFEVTGGYLDGAPVVHVSYHSNLAPVLDRFVGDLGTVVALLGIVLMVMAIHIILSSSGGIGGRHNL